MTYPFYSACRVLIGLQTDVASMHDSFTLQIFFRAPGRFWLLPLAEGSGADPTAAAFLTNLKTMLLEGEDDALVATAEYAPSSSSAAAPKTERAWVESVAESSQQTASTATAAAAAATAAAGMAALGQSPTYVAGEPASLMILQHEPGGIRCEFLLQLSELELVYTHVLQCYARVLIGEACPPNGQPIDQPAARKKGAWGFGPGATAALDGELAQLLGSLPHYDEHAVYGNLDIFIFLNDVFTFSNLYATPARTVWHDLPSAWRVGCMLTAAYDPML